MTTIEKLADDLGQIIFRLETNWDGFEAAISRHDANIVSARRESINSDLEKLKYIKTSILDMDELDN